MLLLHRQQILLLCFSWQESSADHLLSVLGVLKMLHTSSLQFFLLMLYLSFFFGLSWFVCPHFFLRQLVARG